MSICICKNGRRNRYCDAHQGFIQRPITRPKNIIKRTALCYWDNGGLNILIPKIRGDGYLRVPVGHHFNSEIQAIESDFSTNICGLDGYLELEFPYMTSPEKKQKLVREILPRLAKFFKFHEWKEVSNRQFFKILIPEK